MGKVTILDDNAADLGITILDSKTKTILLDVFGVHMPEMLLSFPVVKAGVTIGKLFQAGVNINRARKLISFINGLNDGSNSYKKFADLSAKDQDDIRSLVIAQLDAQTDERQAEATAYLVNAYLERLVNRLSFVGVISELKNINPLIFYFSVDGFSLASIGKEKQVFGPTHYLPTSFVTNSTSKLQFSSQPYLSNLGREFFEYVYTPMSKKYTI